MRYTIIITILSRLKMMQLHAFIDKLLN